MQDYKRLRVTDRAREVIRATYKFTSELPRSEQFGLMTQMRRAAVSLGLNIAEGCSRNSTRELIRYLQIAAGSAMELDFAILITEDLAFGDDAERAALLITPDSVSARTVISYSSATISSSRREPVLSLVGNQFPTHQSTNTPIHYSYRKASIGSSFAARIAGKIPNRTPVSALAASAVAMLDNGVDAGMDGHFVRMKTPVSIPST